MKGKCKICGETVKCIKTNKGLIAVQPTPIRITKMSGARDLFILANGNTIQGFYDPSSDYIGYAPHLHKTE